MLLEDGGAKTQRTWLVISQEWGAPWWLWDPKHKSMDVHAILIGPVHCTAIEPPLEPAVFIC